MLQNIDQYDSSYLSKNWQGNVDFKIEHEIVRMSLWLKPILENDEVKPS